MSSRKWPEAAYDAVENFHQPKKGYRFSADSIALAGFVDLTGVRRAADLGAGCGVVGLTALENLRKIGDPAKNVPDHFYFVERDPGLLDSLKKNIALYQPRIDCQLSLIDSDWRDVSSEHFGGPLDYIMVNPPYFRVDDSRPSPDPSRDAGRREIFGGLPELCSTLTRLLTAAGLAVLILPDARRKELEDVLQNGLKIISVNPSSNSIHSPIIWLLSRTS